MDYFLKFIVFYIRFGWLLELSSSISKMFSADRNTHHRKMSCDENRKMSCDENSIFPLPPDNNIGLMLNSYIGFSTHVIYTHVI